MLSVIRRFSTRSLVLGVLALSVNAAQAVGVPAEIVTAFAQAKVPMSDVALYVKPVNNRKPSLMYRADAAMGPASTMKVVTTYAGLSLLGPAYTWGTEAYVNGSLQQGILQGNLILRGGGDPRWTIERIWLMLRDLQARGVKDIRGDIVLDRRYWAETPTDPNAFDGAGYRPYNVLPDAFLANFQAIRFRLREDAGKVAITMDPALSNLKLDTDLMIGAGDCANWRDQLSVESVPTSGLKLSGLFPAGCGEQELYLSPLPPTAYLSELLRGMWRDLGGQWTGQLRDGQLTAFPGSTLLARYDSPPLSDIVRDINKFSNNTQARMVFLALGGEFQPVEQLLPQARARILDFLALQHIPTDNLILDNGSGLSRQARISARQLGMILEQAVNSPIGPELIASLPIAGIDGTMKSRLHDTPVLGQAHVKTGTLSNVKAVAGVVHTRNGAVVVVGLVNHPHAMATGEALDKLIQWAALSAAR
ncbi:D-alanyl-D-alanine carboxypeptidase/D-alanyl-D-alanine-endopeptidase (penicillin-binding protein 4) [Chitinivorax tropicus]|uniref:D-alanyl-D-alanine carboxypeptidase/D-alanyl-D-alanine-endopeptidase (Penicillin-binding protein 4) n=1 Tax=Chitinivorax tropicus TaxID=714531 RepID=A0A840MWZ3_9PROT|nr:D-alanyl-D-alanine carboxypeptidase/D-alanyl-D-alanine-endopeptidase [Chitinivorax tropicus]MBB5019681.1 D-alanyl-D-alanine carboxypeptidase/D-alanyl-D-alanine-endopeptidase (penicillin-binding protein 4) [Chitinivorax tropicus]